ncbi:hypothetical protein BDV26DRAFT_277328 [Aspergillus bertholletiae]|uniref:Altered inheritance of mitochondria protein 9, mitochondrial n=1 Tax=Aspergillus bertholletiae TaxID=1226010 RepID=A0A5N7BP51_9EURO|nr:hypothetical protein BDV26DRAFT_277328 [Aspergillus bertholletiae]
MRRGLWATLILSNKRIYTRSNNRIFPFLPCVQLLKAYKLNRYLIYSNKFINFDPHSYSNGRWLRQNRSQRAARHIEFDFDALCQKVIDVSPGADTITNCKKLEGGFNRVFIFTLKNARQIVARLPFTLAGPAKLTTASEVAAIKYCSTSIPIPTILDWSNDVTNANNTVDSEYIIMEHAPGVQLHREWHEMMGDQRVRCIDAVYRKVKELVDLRFPAFRSLYFANTPDFGGVRPLEYEFCIGPHCGTRYRDCNVGEQRYYHSVEPNRGPWSNIGEFCDGLINTGLSRLSPQMSTDHRIAEAAIPLMFHPDLHKGNIFVSEGDPAIIKGIIDWQATISYTLSGPRLMDETLFWPLRYSYRTWKDGTVALRHDMIETARRWKELGLAGQCPYSLPTPKDLADHEKEYKLLEAAQVLRRDLANLLNTASDGWVPPKEWEVTELAHREIFTGMLRAVVTNQEVDEDEPVKVEETLRSIWPFDITK